MAKTSDALKILRKRDRDDPEMRKLLEEARLEGDIAQLIYDARVAAGLTQKELAELIGTSQPNVARLEAADYEGHSISMLRRIAAALKFRLEISFVPIDEEQEAA